MKKTKKLIIFTGGLLTIIVAGVIGQLIGEVTSEQAFKEGGTIISSTGLTTVHEDSFVEGCIKAGSSKQECQCVFDDIKEKYSHEDFVAIYDELKGVEDLPKEMKDAMIKCINL